MSAEGLSRRQLMRRGAVAGGAVAGSGLLVPALAAAQASGDDDLRDYLVPATGLEQITVLAYATVADDPATEQLLKKTLLGYRDQEQAHANAWRSALDSLGFDAPDAPTSATDTGVFDGVAGISTDMITEFKDLLGKLDRITPKTSLDFLAGLEERQLTYYLDNAPALDSEDLSTTSAEVAGCQAEHLTVLRQALGASPPDALAAATKAATASTSGSGSSSQ